MLPCRRCRPGRAPPRYTGSGAGGGGGSGRMESVLVAGGAGFIGSNFVRHVLSRTDARVIVLDRLTYAGNRASLADVQSNPRFEFVQGDIADRAAVAALLGTHRPDTVVNLAAETHVDRSIDGPRAFIETNLVGTFELLDAVRQYLERLEPARRARFRFLHVSTDEVYGSLGPTGRFDEGSPYAPNSPYAASKAGADHLVRAYHETYRLPILLTNCSNNYGPYQYPEKLIPLMTLNAIEGKALPIYGDGGNVRDWLHVEDHCAALLLVLRQGAPGGRYNVGAGDEHTNLEIVDGICEALEAIRPAARNAALAGASPATQTSGPSSPTAPVTTAGTPSTRRDSRRSSAGVPRMGFTTASAQPLPGTWGTGRGVRPSWLGSTAGSASVWRAVEC